MIVQLTFLHCKCSCHPFEAGHFGACASRQQQETDGMLIAKEEAGKPH